MKLFGLTGYPLEHSFSPAYFNEKFIGENIHDSEYRLFPLSDISQLDTLVRSNKNLLGLNVTIPFKKTVIPYLHELDEVSKTVGAVNTIKIHRKGNDYHLSGFNTDVIGFEKSFSPFLHPDFKEALILGNGGASMAIQYVLNRLDISFHVVSRNQEEGVISYKQANENYLSNCHLIVNATPLGTFPAVNTCPPLDFDLVGSNHLVLDLVYNPTETMLMKKAAEKGATVINGINMLKYQAEASWQIWNS